MSQKRRRKQKKKTQKKTVMMTRKMTVRQDVVLGYIHMLPAIREREI